MKTLLTGTTFRQKDEDFCKLRPSGEALLVPDPCGSFTKADHKDTKSIAVYNQDIHIGYIKSGSDEQDFINAEWKANRIVKANVIGYGYFGENGFNDNHEGKLQSITLEIDGHCGYFKDDKEYMSITKLLGYINCDGSFEGILRWAFSQFNSFEEYEVGLNLLGNRGTLMHDDIERYFEGAPTEFDPIKNFKEKYEPKVLSMEESVFDDKIMVAGRYDALFEIDGKRILIDWKSSKKASLKHKLQAAWYGTQLGADECWIVTFGSTQKQGYGICKVDKNKMKQYYDIVKYVSKIYYILTDKS